MEALGATPRVALCSTLPTLMENLQLLPSGLGHAKVDHLGHGLAVIQRHQYVGRLDVAMDDALLVRVLDRLADGDE